MVLVGSGVDGRSWAATAPQGRCGAGLAASATVIQSKRQAGETTDTDLPSEQGSGFRYVILLQWGGKADRR